MERRLKELSELHDFIEGVDKEVNMVLRNLQWDRKRFVEEAPKLICTYEKSHNLASEKKELHERQCFLKLHSYDKDLLLPDPLYADAKTLIKLDKQAIITIINNATCGNPLFNQGIRSESPEPWTLERLQATYTMDERRAIHDAVVQAVPSCHDLADLALPSNEDNAENPRIKSRAEILAELRDTKRRRAKYRVAAKTRNYSDVLRDVIKTQMELYGDVVQKTTAELYHHKSMPHEKSKSQYRDDYENPSQELDTSLRGNGRQKPQDYNSASDFQRNRNVKECIPPEKVRSHSREIGKQSQDYYSNSYTKNEQRNNRNDYSRSRYESRKAENEQKERIKDQSRERRVRYYSSSMHEQNNSRENRRRHEYSRTSRHDENYGSQARKRKKNDTSDDSYEARRKKRHREDSASSERKESSSRRKHEKSKNKHAKASRDTGSHDKVRVKSEIDKTAVRHFSENETRYDIHTSRHRNKQRREKHKHKSSHRRDDISIKIERETPESSEIDTQSNFTRTLTHVSTSCNDYTSYSDSDHATSSRDRRTKDSYIHRGSHKQTNVRIKTESTETHSHRNRSSEENDSSSRNRERKKRHVDKYKCNSGNTN